MSYTNRAVQPQKMAKRLEILDLEREEELTIYLAKTKAPIYIFVFAKKHRFSHDTTQITFCV